MRGRRSAERCRWEEGTQQKRGNVLSLATKMSPSVLSLASSISTCVTPSNRLFSHVTGFTALFDHWTPFAGVSTLKYAAQAPYVSTRHTRNTIETNDGVPFACANGSRYQAKKKTRT